MMNKYFGFDEDWGIPAIDIRIDARDKKKEIEEKLLEKQHHDEAMNIIVGIIYDFFRHLGFQGKNEDIMSYIDQHAVAERIWDSLGNANVPEWLRLEAVNTVRDDAAGAYVCRRYAEDATEKEHLRIIASTMNAIKNQYANK